MKYLAPNHHLCIKYIATYAAVIWFPNALPSSIVKLQPIRNTTFRISTKMASVSHLRSES